MFKQLANYFTTNFKFNNGKNDGKIIIKYNDEIIINVHKEILLLSSEYFKNIYQFDSKNYNDDNIFSLFTNNNNNNSQIIINLPSFLNYNSKIHITNALLILFNLLYDSDYDVKNNVEYKSSEVYILVHEITDFLLLDDKTVDVLLPFDNLVINILNWQISTYSVISILNSLSLCSSNHIYVKKFINSICRYNPKKVKLMFFTHINSSLNNTICKCKLCRFVIKYNNIPVNQNKILVMFSEYISKL
jgi:hypothetical protein